MADDLSLLEGEGHEGRDGLAVRIIGEDDGEADKRDQDQTEKEDIDRAHDGTS